MNILEENKKCPFINSCNHIDCDKHCMKNFKTNYYFNQAMIPENKRIKFPLRVDNTQDEEIFRQLTIIESNICDYVEKGSNIYLWSKQAGVGKTSWAYRFAIQYINKVWSYKDIRPIVLFISIPKFLLDLKSNISQKSSYIEHIFDNVLNADMVIWDDIGSKLGTEFEVSHLLSLIDNRVNNSKLNIYTSNLSGEELHEALGDRLYSRIFNYSIVYEIKGKDKRGLSI